MAVLALWAIGLGVAVVVLGVVAWVGRSRHTDTYDQVEQFQRFRAAFREEAASPPQTSTGRRPIVRGAK
ncbi:MAG: hypothetical protein ACRDN9_09840 [Streptosporangiaceae bacterium]